MPRAGRPVKCILAAEGVRPAVLVRGGPQHSALATVSGGPAWGRQASGGPNGFVLVSGGSGWLDVKGRGHRVAAAFILVGGGKAIGGRPPCFFFSLGYVFSPLKLWCHDPYYPG